MLKREADPSSPSAYTRPLSASSDYPMPPPPPPPAEDRGHPVAQHYAPRVEHQSPVNAPPNYRNNYPPPHSPLSATPTFETHPPNFHPYPPAILPYAAPLATTAKRKAQRAAQACDSCRTLKAKCDEGRPDCGSCREKGIKCIYRDPPPKQ